MVYYQNDTLNIRADQEMLNYLHKGSRREKRTVFQKRSSASKSSAAVKSCLDSLSRQIRNGQAASVDKPTSAGAERTRGASELGGETQSTSSPDLLQEAVRYTSNPMPEEAEDEHLRPTEEEAQSLLSQFVNKSKRSEISVNVVHDLEQSLAASHQSYPSQEISANTFKQESARQPFADVGDARSKQHAYHDSASNASGVFIKRDRLLSKSLKRAADGKIKLSETLEKKRDLTQTNENLSKASPNSVRTTENSQRIPFKEDVSQKGSEFLTDKVDGVNNDASCLFTSNVAKPQQVSPEFRADDLKTKHHTTSSQNVVSSSKQVRFSNNLFVDKHLGSNSQKTPLNNTPSPRLASSVHKNSRESSPSSLFTRPSTSSLGKESFAEEDQFGESQTMAPNRPRRANATRVNYSLKLPRISPGPEDTNVTSKDTVHQVRTEAKASKPSPSPARTPELCQTRVILSSETCRVDKERLPSSISNLFKDRENAPYRDKGSLDRAIRDFESGKQAPSPKAGVIVHVDFDIHEQEAVLDFILKDGPQGNYISDSDIMIQDRLIQAAKVLDFDPHRMASRIDKMRKLRTILLQYKNDIGKIFLSAKQGTDILSSNDSREASKLVYQLYRVMTAQGTIFTLPAALKTVREEDIPDLVQQMLPTDSLKLRKERSLERFLTDTKSGRLSTTPSLIRICDPQSREKHLDRAYDPPNSSGLLRSRELGGQHHKTSRLMLDRKLQDSYIKPQKSWKGASNDVIVLTWSPDGTRFAAGATAQCDTHTMAYNRGNNLVLGDLTADTLQELPDHWIPRPPPANDMADPKLYMSVSAVRWAPWGNRLFTSSYDKTVKLWDVSNPSNTRCIHTFPHPAKMQVLALSQYHPSLVAVGHDSDSQSFGLWSVTESHGNVSDATYTDLDIVRTRPGKKAGLLPSCLAWGTSPASKDFLVAGMSSNKPEDVGDPPREGFLTAWRVGESSLRQINLSPNSQNVFDISWNQTQRYFATAGSIPTSARARGLGLHTRSLVRIYDPHQTRNIYEFECPAIDINDVSFCPTNPNYISASCTDGTTYVWDYRMGDEIVHQLCHGAPLSELDQGMTREQADVGVRVSLWGDSTDRFFTGSSDGVLKSWDILRAPSDAHLQDITSLDSEIMSGAFSPDKTNILLGDSSGGVHLLSASPFSSNSENESFDFIGASEKSKEAEDAEFGDIGVRTAREYLATGQLVHDPRYGPGQGPNYAGPYGAWARPKDTPRELLAQTPLITEVQKEQKSQRPSPLPKNRKRPGSSSTLEGKRRKQERVQSPEIIVISDDEDDESPRKPRRFDAASRKDPSPSIKAESDDEVETLVERLEEDYWWPASGSIDPNIKDSEA